LTDNIEAPTATDLNVAVKRALPRNSGSFSITYSRRDYKNLLEDFVGEEGTVEVNDPNNPLNVIGTFDLTRWGNSDLATRRYQSITSTWEYRPGVRWNIGGNYTWSQTTGNYEGETRNRPSSGSPLHDYVRSISIEAAAPDGFLDEDITHRLLAWGNYRLDLDKAGSLNLGGILRYQSGQVWSRIGTVGINDDPDYLNDIGSYNYYFDGRGNNRFNGFWRMDLSARYSFPVFRDDVSGWLKLDALNVLNNDELIAFGTAGSAVTNAAGTLVWEAAESFGSIPSQANYQIPRTYLVTLGIQF
jgi:hypothetical protein